MIPAAPVRRNRDADLEERGQCRICSRTEGSVDDLPSDDQLQRLAAGTLTVDEMIDILFELGDLF